MWPNSSVIFFGNLFGFQVEAVHSSFISEEHKKDLVRHHWLSWQICDVIEASWRRAELLCYSWSGGGAVASPKTPQLNVNSKNRASNKYYPLACENRNELPFFSHEERLRSETQINIFFFCLIWLVCFWDFGPLFWMPGRCVYFYMTAVWYSEDEEKHQQTNKKKEFWWTVNTPT